MFNVFLKRVNNFLTEQRMNRSALRFIHFFTCEFVIRPLEDEQKKTMTFYHLLLLENRKAK